MNKKRVFRFLGFLYVLFGVFFILNSFSSITGFVIVNEIVGTTSSIFGIVFIIFGILMLSASIDDRLLESDLRIEELEAIEKSIRRHEKKENARSAGLKNKYEEQIFPKNLAEATRTGRINDYLKGKNIEYITNRPPTYKDKHTKLVGKDLFPDEEQVEASKYEGSQFLSDYSIKDILKIEERIVKKGNGFIRGDNHVIFYGKGHSKRSPTGKSITGYDRRKDGLQQPTTGMAVEVEESGNKILIHGYPVSEREIRDYKRTYKGKK